MHHCSYYDHKKQGLNFTNEDNIVMNNMRKYQDSLSEINFDNTPKNDVVTHNNSFATPSYSKKHNISSQISDNDMLAFHTDG